ncbi:MAG: glycoside hydrolase, partial [Candidatus Omnitrophica bacterium CG11_big_fil_rev_8_21_14_0_20_41_12]
WKGSIRLRPGRYQYRFFVDGKWVDDPNAKQIVQNEFGTKNTLLEVK